MGTIWQHVILIPYHSKFAMHDFDRISEFSKKNIKRYFLIDWFCPLQSFFLLMIFHWIFWCELCVVTVWRLIGSNGLCIWSFQNSIYPWLKVSKFQNEIIVSPKVWTKDCKDFYPVVWHSKSLQFLVHILGETMAL